MGQEKLLIRQENFGYLLYSIPMKCYYTVKNNVTYGLSVYDHIVLDASSVGEGQLLYQ